MSDTIWKPQRLGTDTWQAPEHPPAIRLAYTAAQWAHLGRTSSGKSQQNNLRNWTHQLQQLNVAKGGASGELTNLQRAVATPAMNVI